MINRPCILFFCALVLPALADVPRGVSYSPSVTPDRFEQRERYLEAMQLIREGRFRDLQKVKPALRTYALYPYIEYTEMASRMSRYSEEEVLAFINQNRDTPLVQPMLRHWLSSLARHHKWELFTRHFADVRASTELKCHYAYALYNAGKRQAAFELAVDLWTVGVSQPDECDPIFNVWRGQDGMTPEIAWQRFSLAVKNSERRLASYLIRFVDSSDRQFAENYRLVHRRPETIKRYTAFSAPHPRNREIILHGVRRLARRDPANAFAALQMYETMHRFEPGELENTWAYIGTRLARDTEDMALLDSLPIDLHRHPDLIVERLRQSLKLEDWSNLIVLINLLPVEAQQSPRWQYWKARVLAQSDAAGDRAVAREIFTELAGERTFYGFLSADILQADYNYRDEPSPVPMDQVLSLEQMPGIQRALELFALGERASARREWYFSTADFTLRERRVAARVALRWGWYKAAIQTMIDAEDWNHLDFRFPLAYQDTFIAHARRANIPVQLSLAIARQESAFMPDARSRSGALGLMQLMPGTAEKVANQLGVSYDNNASLWQPDLNVLLGTNYLAEMLRRFDNNRILASAAYNAGPGNVDRWLRGDRPNTLAFDAWIELIPFTETRGYVQNVLMFSSIYSRKLQEQQPLIYPHERNFFSPRQISGLQSAPSHKPKS